MSNNSSYIDTLPAAEKARYLDKVSIINGFDPYDSSTCKEEWQNIKQGMVNILPSVCYPDIVNYLVFNPSAYTLDDLKAYKGLQAYNYVVSGWVRDVGAIVKNNLHVVKAKVMHSQSLRDKLLNPWIIAEKSGKVISGHCDCMAGLGETCSHVAALLFYIDVLVQQRESKTVTEDKAYWVVPTSMTKIEYKRIRDIDWTSAKTKQKKLINSTKDTTDSCTPIRQARVMKKSAESCVPTSDELASFFQTISMCGTKPAILSIIEPYSDNYVPKATTPSFPQVLTDLYDPSSVSKNFTELLNHCKTVQISLTDEQVKNVEEATRTQAKSKLWFRYRSGRITASRFKAACSTNVANPSASLIKSICYPENARFTSASTTWGCLHEKQARSEYFDRVKNLHANIFISDSGLLLNPSYPGFGASPDGIVQCDCCGIGCIEVKCPFCIRLEKLSDDGGKLTYLEKVDGQLKLKKNHEHYFQIQCQMNLGNFEYCDFVVWTEKDLHVERIECDSAFFEEKVHLANEFFRVGVLPELIGKFYSRPPLKSIDQNVNSTPEHVEVEPTVQMWCLCKEEKDGDLVGCDNPLCPVEWFHLNCVGIKNKKTLPKKWYCPDCRKLPQFNRRSRNKTL